jgi:NhaP-type Na+/H+ and K+/H+ antiporter
MAPHMTATTAKQTMIAPHTNDPIAVFLDITILTNSASRKYLKI